MGSDLENEALPRSGSWEQGEAEIKGKWPLALVLNLSNPYQKGKSGVKIPLSQAGDEESAGR